MVWSSSLSFLEGQSASKQKEALVNNRSVMPLDVLGRTRATLTQSTSFNLVREDWVIFGNCVVMGIDRCNSIINEEFLVSAFHIERADNVPALCTHRPSLVPIGF